MAISAARVTRLGLSGFMRRPYGSFAGKEATEEPADTSGTRRQRQIKSLTRSRRRRR